jgi:hypothetical protein
LLFGIEFFFVGFCQQGFQIRDDELTPLVERIGLDSPIPSYISQEFRQYLDQQVTAFIGTTEMSNVLQCREVYLHLINACSENGKLIHVQIFIA